MYFFATVGVTGILGTGRRASRLPMIALRREHSRMVVLCLRRWRAPSPEARNRQAGFGIHMNALRPIFAKPTAVLTDATDMLNSA